MSTSRSAVGPSLRQSGIGSLVLLGVFIVANACSSFQPTPTGPEPAIVAFDIREQGAGTAADSAEVLHRQTGQTLRTNSAGDVRFRNLRPALHLFTVDGYGLHDRRHISVLLSSDDSSNARTVSLRPKRLRVTCRGRPALYRAVAASLAAPSDHSYWYVPSSATRGDTPE